VTARVVVVSPIDRGGRRTSLIGEQLDQALPATEWLEEAVLRHSAMLLAAARALTRDEADARDLVQTTMEIALRKGAQIRDQAALPAWLLIV
jgi:DNA-directed RNA polymerase specialized sigma24 family protein